MKLGKIYKASSGNWHWRWGNHLAIGPTFQWVVEAFEKQVRYQRLLAHGDRRRRGGYR